jgi:hypothetical protein
MPFQITIVSLYIEQETLVIWQATIKTMFIFVELEHMKGARTRSVYFK